MFKYFKNLGRQIFVYGLGDTINKVISILIVPIFSRFLTPADYGVSGVLLVTSSLLLGVCDLGLSNGITRFFHEEEGKKRATVISTAQLAMVFSALLIFVLAWPFSGQISQMFFQTSSYGDLVWMTFLTVPLTLAVSAPMMRWRLENKAKTYAFFNVARVVTGVGLNIVLIVFLKHGVRGLFEGPLINAAFYAVVIGVYSIITNGFSFSRALFGKMMKFSAPFIFGLLAFWVMDWADRLILTRFVSLSEVGLYNLGYSVGMAIMLPVGAFATAWPPFYMSVAKQPDAKKIYSLAFTYYSLIIGFFILLISVFSRDYFYFFTPEVFHNAYIVVPLIALAYALKGNFAITAVGGFLEKRTVFEFIADLLAAVLNIAAMFILIPLIGRLGAAWATLLAYAILPLSMYILTYRFFPVRYEFRRIIQIIIVGMAVYYLCNFIYEPTLMNLGFRVLIIFLYPAVLFVTGFFHAGELERLKNLKPKVSETMPETAVTEDIVK